MIWLTSFVHLGTKSGIKRILILSFSCCIGDTDGSFSPGRMAFVLKVNEMTKSLWACKLIAWRSCE